MQAETKQYFSPVTDSISKLRKYLSDRILITDLVAKLVITFGVVLLIGGLYLMINGAGVTNQAAQTLVSTVDWVPGIPFSVSSLTNVGASTVGLVSWFIGLDLLLVGLGLWIRHGLARFTAVIIFALSACYEFIQLLFLGIIGAPASIVQLCLDAILVYVLFSRFDSTANVKKQLSS